MQKLIILTIAAIAFTSCQKKQETCHTAEEMMGTNPASRLGYTEHGAVKVSELSCNKFAVIVTTTDGKQCGYIMKY